MVAVTYDPMLKRMYTAIKGKGAYLNGQRLRLSKTEPAGRRGSVTVEIRCGDKSILTDPAIEPALTAALVQQGQVPLYLCAAAYEAMLVASGEINGVIFGGTSAWDGAAISLIIQEAGGLVTDLRGQPQRYDGPIYGFIAARPHWHERLRSLVAPYLPQD